MIHNGPAHSGLTGPSLNCNESSWLTRIFALLAANRARNDDNSDLD